MTYDRIDKFFDDGDVGITEVAFPALDHFHCVVVLEPFHTGDSTGALPGSEETNANKFEMVHASRSVAVFLNNQRLTPAEKRRDIERRDSGSGVVSLHRTTPLARQPVVRSEATQTRRCGGTPDTRPASGNGGG